MSFDNSNGGQNHQTCPSTNAHATFFFFFFFRRSQPFRAELPRDKKKEDVTDDPAALSDVLWNGNQSTRLIRMARQQGQRRLTTTLVTSIGRSFNIKPDKCACEDDVCPVRRREGYCDCWQRPACKKGSPVRIVMPKAMSMSLGGSGSAS